MPFRLQSNMSLSWYVSSSWFPLTWLSLSRHPARWCSVPREDDLRKDRNVVLEFIMNSASRPVRLLKFDIIPKIASDDLWNGMRDVAIHHIRKPNTMIQIKIWNRLLKYHVDRCGRLDTHSSKTTCQACMAIPQIEARVPMGEAYSCWLRFGWENYWCIHVPNCPNGYPTSSPCKILPAYVLSMPFVFCLPRDCARWVVIREWCCGCGKDRTIKTRFNKWCTKWEKHNSVLHVKNIPYTNPQTCSPG